MTTELDTLSAALYVHIDDRLKTSPRRGRPPRLTDAELVTLAVAQA
ncbi:IS982 family transposase, partial [Streptomyces indiaensis]|nr:IS982 family transposase [Streptomyces indiaensis]MCF1646457.1 IS982 family transposase [Streptomyces indiaensis]